MIDKTRKPRRSSMRVPMNASTKARLQFVVDFLTGDTWKYGEDAIELTVATLVNAEYDRIMSLFRKDKHNAPTPTFHTVVGNGPHPDSGPSNLGSSDGGAVGLPATGVQSSPASVDTSGHGADKSSPSGDSSESTPGSVHKRGKR